MKNNSKDIYMAPQITVDAFICAELICVSNTAINESFSEEINIVW